MNKLFLLIFVVLFLVFGGFYYINTPEYKIKSEVKSEVSESLRFPETYNAEGWYIEPDGDYTYNVTHSYTAKNSLNMDIRKSVSYEAKYLKASSNVILRKK